MMTDCPELEEDPDAEKCQNCNKPCQKEEPCYIGANMENRPPRGNSQKLKRKLLKPIIKLENQYKRTKNDHNNPRQRI